MEDKLLELTQARHKILEALESARKVAAKGEELTQLERSLSLANLILLKLIRKQTLPFTIAIETRLRSVTVPGVKFTAVPVRPGVKKTIILPIKVEPLETETAAPGTVR